MKKLLQIVFLFLAVTLSGVEGSAQNYKSFLGDSNTVWNTHWGFCDGECTDTVRVTGDTIINSFAYKKIQGNSINNGIGFLRQDTILGKAWFLNTFNNNEYLIMDLSLGVADPFVIYDFLNSPFTIYVDSVYYKSGLKHIRFNHWISICQQVEKLTFIEGSGTNAGVAYQPPVNWPYPNTYLLCHFKDGTKIYGNTFYNDSCYVCYVGINETTDNFSFSISPNPSTGIFTLISSEKSSQLIITDVLGNVVLRQTVNQKQETINLFSQPKGIYFVKVMDEKGNFGVRKIVLQ